MSLRIRVSRVAQRAAWTGRWLLVAASASAAMAGVTLALDHARIHTLMVYAAVGLAAIGTLLALPAALATSPLTPEENP